MLQKNVKLALLAATIFCSPFISAQGLNPPLPDLVMSLSGGPSWAQSGNKQTLSLTPDIDKTYTVDHSTHTFAEGAIFLGIQEPLAHSLKTQLGFSLERAGSAVVSGDIWDDADETFNNHTYQYKIQHSHINFAGKLIGEWGWPVMPWVSGSLGVGFNDAHGFSNTPTIEEAVVDPKFKSNTSTAFNYTLGIGIERALTQQLQIGLGYEFADWGASQLGRASGQTLDNGPSLSHLYTNSVLFNITYIT